MNANEYGILFEFGTGFDMSGNTSLSLVFTRPDATVLTVTNPAVTISAAAAPPFLGNQYMKYTFASGDINQAGSYSVRAIYNDGLPSHLISNVGTFVVGA